jgi:hypothetical protein
METRELLRKLREIRERCSRKSYKDVFEEAIKFIFMAPEWKPVTSLPKRYPFRDEKYDGSPEITEKDKEWCVYDLPENCLIYDPHKPQIDRYTTYPKGFSINGNDRFIDDLLYMPLIMLEFMPKSEELKI